MHFHYDKTVERVICPAVELDGETPAWLMICLAKLLKDWLGEGSRASYESGGALLRLGYEVQTFSTAEFARSFGSALSRIHDTWPVQVFGLAPNGELVGLSFTREQKMLVLRQQTISGCWHEELRDLYFSIQFLDPRSAECMFRILRAIDRGECAAAFEWSCADFLEEQRLSRLDHTCSFCYVCWGEDEDDLDCLAGLTMEQKEVLWRLFLEKRLLPPEFEWLRNALLKDVAPNWAEWNLALYHVLEQLKIRFLCRRDQFELLDGEGKRVYFSVEHAEAAEQVLMKILFPLHQ